MANDIIDRLHCRYAMGPMINGAPEFGYRDFSGPITTTLPTALMLEAAKEIASLRETRDVLLSALKAVEWADFEDSCPSCSRERKHGHTHDCRVAAALAKARGA